MFRSGLKRAFDRALVVLLCLAMPTPAVDASALAAQRQGGDRAQARDRVGVCHRTGSARWPFVFLELPAASVEAHRGHGDVVGVESWRDCPGGPATATPTTSPTATKSPTATRTATASATATATATRTVTATATASPTDTETATASPTGIATATATEPPSETPGETDTATATETATPTETATSSPTDTPPTGSTLPPDPAAVAPPVEPGVATDLAAATAFLYSGPSPIQSGVAPGAIDARRAAVLRGRVLDRDGQPLPGASVAVLNAPGLGQTLSRADGAFDLAVNGGGKLTVRYDRPGFLPVHRDVEPAWREFARLPDVVMIPLDNRVTAVDLAAGAPLQVARGSVVADADGVRQATLLFPAGTTARLTFGSGPGQPAARLSIRATEYTVGPNGPSAMPAALPPNSFYTYAVELSADEADAAGATGIRFSRPVYLYVENFLDFPVGGAVPNGFYDRQGGSWVADDDGRVVRVLGADASGLADLDVDGDGLADDAAALAALGFGDAERAELAALYAPGQSLWRVPITHFSPRDCNWSPGPPVGAGYPDQPAPGGGEPEEDPCAAGGYSVVECQNQVLIETLAVPHTPFRLSYRSDRAPGRRIANTLTIPLSGATVPTSLVGIELVVQVAGQEHRLTFPADPNQTHTFVWDGLDAYGRALTGEQVASVRIGYAYRPDYLVPASVPRSFGLASGGSGAGGSRTIGRAGRDLFVFWQERRAMVGVFDARAQALGGWTLDAHHAYDPNARVLHLGDGTRRGAGFAARLGQLTVEGVALPGSRPDGIALTDDGTLYTAVGNVVRRVRADEMGGAAAGAVAAGTGQPGLNGDSTALQTRLNGPRGLAPGPGGGVTVPVLDDRGQPIGTRQVGRAVLYIADTQNHLVRELIPAVPGGSEFVRTIAGDATGVPGFAGEGWPGTSARLSRPTGLAVGPDGSLYIADTGNHRVRRLMPPTNSAFLDGGLLFTVAGTGAPGYGGDGGPATQAQLSAPEAVSVGLDGSVYVADTGNHAIRRVGPDGVITTVAGTGVEGFSEDGVPAAQARLSRPRGVVAARDGTLFFSEGGAHLLRRVLVDGTLTTVAGRSPQNGSPRFGLDDDEDVPAVGALLNNPGALALGPLGSLFFADTTNDRVRRVAGDFPAPGATRFVLPAEDGREAYVFDGQGRHVQTVDGLTAATRHSFGYDSANRVVTVTDGDGNATTIERDASGAPLAIVGPYGQRSALTVDASGRLASLTTPGGALHQLVHDRDGLLTRRTDPRGGEYTFDYEPATGRLTRAADPAGGSTILARVDTPTGYQVTRTDAPGRVTTYTVEALPGGGQRRLNAFPDGTTTEALRLPDGSHRVSRSDGAVVTTRHGPDPRWGMLAPLAASIETSRGELGPTTHAAHERTVRLTDALDPLSLDSLRDTLTINGRTTTRAFDAASRTVTETTPEGRQTVTTLDALGRPNGVQAPGLSPVSLSRDGRGRLEQLSQGAGPTVRAIALGYGPDGQPGSVTDPVASTSGLQRDLDGRITAVTLADARVFGAGYDENGNLTSFTPPGRPPQSFSHTSVDLIETATLPDVGDGPATTRFAYTPDRRLARVERPDGSIATVTRDAAGRAEQVTTPDGALTYRYDPTTGRAATIIAPDGGALSLTYAGGLLTESTWRGAVQGSVQESRDGDLRVATRGVNGGPPDTFLRDRDGRLTQAGALALQRDAQSGRLVGTSLGGVTTTLARNAFGEVERESASHDGTPLLETSYTRDALGRVTLRSETVGGTTSTFEYRYDASHRLREVRRDGVPIGDYGYDENDNRTSATTTAGTVVGTYDDQDRLLQHGAASYRYTAAGVLRSRSIGAQVTGYRYDVFGGLRRVDQADGTRIDYLTDGRHRRIGKRVDGVLVQAFLYQDRLHPVAELDGASNVVSRFVYASRAQVPDYMERAGVLYRIIADHLGSPRLVVDSQSGAVAQRLDYDAWGNVTLDTNPGFQPFGFAGGLYDPDTRLVRFGVRDYDAETGRWTARDPRFLGSGANSYGYAFADPVNLVDPEGTTPNSTTTSGTASTEPWDEITEPWRPPWEEITVEDLGPVGERIRVPATDPSECPETRTSETSADRNKEPKYLPDPTPSEMLLQALIGLAAAVAAAITFFAPEVLPAVGPALAPAR